LREAYQMPFRIAPLPAQASRAKVSPSRQAVVLEGCYHISAAEHSKLGFYRALGLGLASLGLPQGNVKN